MDMKRYLSAVVLSALFGSSVALSVPAMPGLRTVKQPDGTEIKLRLWGDEWLHGYETPDGYTVVKDSNGYYVYAVRDKSGNLMPSKVKVGQAPPAGLQKSLRPKNTATINKVRALKKSSAQRVVPSKGTGKLPVVLINFTDTTTTKTPAEFNTLFFGTNPGDYSMRQYYQEVSNGNFDVQGVILGWYTAQKNHDYYGQNDQNGNDMYPGDLVYEAAQAADPNVDFSQYDTDGDCKVDVLAVVHQGTGEETSASPNGGSVTDIWSHRWSLSSAKAYGKNNYSGAYVTNDPCPNGGNIIVDDYIIMSELYDNTGKIATVGLMAHEYAHAFGLPDLYDPDYSSHGIGVWGLMGAGTWLGVTVGGDRPSHMSAWSKAVLGWANVQTLTGQGTLTLNPVEGNNTIYKIGNGTPGQSGEYLLLENRQRIGFDAALPGAGLLIWHIDESKKSASNQDNASECKTDHGSCGTAHYRIALEQADGNFDLEKNQNTGDAGDPFPGNSNKTTFDVNSTPSSKPYCKNTSTVSLTNITVAGNDVQLTYNIAGAFPVQGLVQQAQDACGATTGGGGGGDSKDSGGGCSAGGLIGGWAILGSLVTLALLRRRFKL